MTRESMVELFENAAAHITEREVAGLDENTEISTLGLDSLGMLELVGEMERQLGVHLPDDQLVGLRTVRDLLDLVELAGAPRWAGPLVSARAELERRVYERYASFFDEAERERRWNPFRDIPWERANPEASPALVLCAETFCAVESYLPDYVSKGINAVKESFGQAWFAANWAYEESKHSIALMEYLIRAGHRTLEQMLAMQAELRQREWQLPFATARQMTLYGVFQEMATFFIYCRQEARAHAEHDEALRTIFRLAARDEIAHTRFYQDVIRLLLAEDREGCSRTWPSSCSASRCRACGSSPTMTRAWR